MTLWSLIPTLDINDTDSDILYTVELYQITMSCGQNILIHQRDLADNNVTEEGLGLMQIYKAVIATRNNVRGGRNGPVVETKDIILQLALIQCSAQYSLLPKFQRRGNPMLEIILI